MISFSSSQMNILNQLSDGACHSGSELGKILGITRSAIWKQIKQLIDLGVPIKSLPQQGYQLPKKMIFLNADDIKKALHSPHYNLHVLTSIDSTNRFLKDLPTSNQVEVCCAEMQTQGRGRFGRYWHSPFGENIYCSSRWNLHYDLSKLSGLSLVTSLAILAALKEALLSSEIQIKWPNDLYWSDKKLCGSLIEITAESNGNAQVIIGIGLNVNTDTKIQPLPEKPWCSLYEITQQNFNRNLLIATLINKLNEYLNQFMQNDLNYFMNEWNAADYLAGKLITVTQPLTTLSGKACGINSMGQLILVDNVGVKHLLSTGDTSLQGGM